jgi:hypothetical protein
MGLASLDGPAAGADDAVAKATVIDLTTKMRPDGSLDWTPPPGQWTVLRMGYSLTGKENSPASPEATGLEVDKLSATHVKNYFTKYLDMYQDATGGLMGKRGLQYVVTDSWEAGAQNWTEDMIAEFTKRRGYDPRPWLPALASHIVESAVATDRFLWDYRTTLAELTAANHYDQLTTILHERGMARYSESHEDRRALIADGMEVKRTAAIPMSAMWTGRGGPLCRRSSEPTSASRRRSPVSWPERRRCRVVDRCCRRACFTPREPSHGRRRTLSLNRFVIHTSAPAAGGQETGPARPVWPVVCGRFRAEQAGPWARIWPAAATCCSRGMSSPTSSTTTVTTRTSPRCSVRMRRRCRPATTSTTRTRTLS